MNNYNYRGDKTRETALENLKSKLDLTTKPTEGENQ